MLRTSRRWCHAFESVLKSAKEEDLRRKVGYNSLKEITRRTSGAADLKDVVKAIERLDKEEVPQTPHEFLDCFKDRIKFTDLQCLQLGVLMQRFNIINKSTYKDLCLYYERHYVAHRTLSLLCVTCAKYGDVKRAMFYVSALTQSKEVDRVRWPKLLPSVYKAIGYSSEASDELFSLFKKTMSLSVWTAVVEHAAYQGQEDLIKKSMHEAREVGYDPEGRDGTYHALLLSLRSPAPDKALLTKLHALCEGDVLAHYPQLHQNIHNSSLSSSTKKAYHNLIDGKTAVVENHTDSGLCYAFKMGECRDISCKKSHQLVSCRHGDACTIHKCPYVHPYEIASRWATEQVQTVQYKRDKKENTITQQAVKEQVQVVKEQVVKEQVVYSTNNPPPPPEQPKAKAKNKDVEVLLRDLKGMRLRDPPVLTTADKDSMSKLRMLVGRLQNVHEKPKKPVERITAPAALVSTYQRIPFDAIPLSPAKQLLDACNDKQAPKPPPLPSFERERNACQTSRLLSLLRTKGRLENRPKAPQKPAVGNPAVPKTDASWFNELADIMK
eukprot:TRINITY_DN34185_c0_g1_i1.p1 TRINITY_DN34185_c0_g1~~TRINITY_DN34185_c0_g1_i1.p1  ORF type:complete len:553 (+),score=90.85 TRINITY_DN34185_c0_g1_i1:41-1699(+)